jgi:hypothetical protein
MVMIFIDFVAGSHGNYLKFVCNKFLARLRCNDEPFDSNGASHNAQYKDRPVFLADHYFQKDRNYSDAEKIISIRFTEDDLLPLTAVSLLRAGNYGYDNAFLEKNTYNKLNNIHYHHVLNNLINSFFLDQVKTSYNSVKDSSWPTVETLEDFSKLPARIRSECNNIHKLKIFEFNEKYPNCPRSVLREFFKIGFKKPYQSGFIKEQERMIYDKSLSVLNIPYNSFYDLNKFLGTIEEISNFTGYQLDPDDVPQLEILHAKFLDRQIYKDYKTQMDSLFSKILEENFISFENLDLLQEAYLDALCENQFKKEAPADSDQWFNNSKELLGYYNV